MPLATIAGHSPENGQLAAIASRGARSMVACPNVSPHFGSAFRSKRSAVPCSMVLAALVASRVQLRGSFSRVAWSQVLPTTGLLRPASSARLCLVDKVASRMPTEPIQVRICVPERNRGVARVLTPLRGPISCPFRYIALYPGYSVSDSIRAGESMPTQRAESKPTHESLVT